MLTATPYSDTIPNPSRMREQVLLAQSLGLNAAGTIDVLHGAGWFQMTHVHSLGVISAVRNTILDTPETAEAILRRGLAQEGYKQPLALQLLDLTSESLPYIRRRHEEAFNSGDVVYANRHLPEPLIRRFADLSSESRTVLHNPSLKTQWVEKEGRLFGEDGEAFSGSVLCSPLMNEEMLQNEAVYVANIYFFLNNPHFNDQMFFRLMRFALRKQMRAGVSTNLLKRMDSLSSVTDQCAAIMFCINNADTRELSSGIPGVDAQKILTSLHPDESFDNIARKYLWPLLLENLESMALPPLAEVLDRVVV